MTETETDEALAERAKAGQQPAFDALVRRHKARLYRFVRLYVGQADDAYDVLQDAFISAWEGLRRYDSARPFLPWLRTIALNKCRDHARRQAVRNRLLKMFVWQSAPALAVNDPESSGANGDRLTRLDAAIAGLPAFYKEPLLLTMVAGLSQRDIALQLKTTPKAVEMRIRRAKQKLEESIRAAEREG